MYKLIIEDDEGKTTVVPLIRDEITIGRKEGNTIRLTERNVSRRAAKITKKDDLIEVEDVASRYGVKRNGKKLDKKVPFREGDVVLIGDYRLSLQSDRKVQTPVSAGLQRDRPAASAAAEPAQPVNLPPARAAKLVVVSSNFAGREYPLTGAEMIIGRTEGDIRIDHRSISRNHAKFVRDGAQYKVIDLNSANGVKVNGEEYRSVQLKRGDIVELGHVRFRFVEPGENFIFRPDPAWHDDDIDEPVASGGAGKIVIVGVIGGLIALVLVLVAVIVVAFSGGDGGNNSNGGGNTPNVTDNGPSSTDSEVNDFIKSGKDAMDKEEWDQAIVYFDLALKKEPSNSEARSLKSKCNTEKPFRETFKEGKVALESGDYKEAISKFKSIPADVSTYGEKIKEQSLLSRAQEKLADKYVDEARRHMKKREWIAAKKKVNMALDVDPDHVEAKALLEDLNEGKGDKDDAGTAPKKKNDGGRKVTAPKEKTPPKDNGGGGMSADEKKAKLKELLSSAQKNAMGANPDQAISQAREALKYGAGARAYRILGLAYERKGDNGNMIKYYNLWLKSNCGSKLADFLRKKIVRAGGSPSC